MGLLRTALLTSGHKSEQLGLGLDCQGWGIGSGLYPIQPSPWASQPTDPPSSTFLHPVLPSPTLPTPYAGQTRLDADSVGHCASLHWLSQLPGWYKCANWHVCESTGPAYCSLFSYYLKTEDRIFKNSLEVQTYNLKNKL